MLPSESNTRNIRDVISQLESPISDVSILLALLTSVLDCLGLLSPQFGKYNVNPLPVGSVVISRHIPTIQRHILGHVQPTWGAVLSELKASVLLKQFFCPDSFSFTSSTAGEVVLHAHSTILSLLVSPYSAGLLSDLSKEYPIDRIYFAIFSNTGDAAKQNLAWEDHVRNLAAIPGKVANALGPTNSVPDLLEHGTYFHQISLRCQCLVKALSIRNCNGILSLFMHFKKLAHFQMINCYL